MKGYLSMVKRKLIPFTDRARICFKCYIEKEKKCSFENTLVKKSESSTNLK